MSINETSPTKKTDDRTCRLEDSVGCFIKTLNDPNYPKKTPLYLIFNKVDVLLSKISNGFDLTCKFSDQEQLKCFKKHGHPICSLVVPLESRKHSYPKLDHDTLSQVLKFLTPVDLFNCMLVSKEYYQAAMSDLVWFEQCKAQHLFISHEIAIRNIEKHCANFVDKQDEQSVFYAYYKHKGFVLENSIDFLVNYYQSFIASNVNYKGFMITNAIDQQRTSEMLVNSIQSCNED